MQVILHLQIDPATEQSKAHGRQKYNVDDIHELLDDSTFGDSMTSCSEKSSSDSDSEFDLSDGEAGINLFLAVHNSGSIKGSSSDSDELHYPELSSEDETLLQFCRLLPLSA